SDNQPWMLWLDPDEKVRDLPDGKVYHFANLATGKESWSVKTLFLFRATALSPDGKYLAVILHDKPSLVMLWDARTGNKIADLGEHKHAIERLVFSPDSQTLATGSHHTSKVDLSVQEPGEVKLWDVEKRKEQAACQIPATCTALQFTADGKRLFAAMNRGLKT